MSHSYNRSVAGYQGSACTYAHRISAISSWGGPGSPQISIHCLGRPGTGKHPTAQHRTPLIAVGPLKGKSRKAQKSPRQKPADRHQLHVQHAEYQPSWRTWQSQHPPTPSACRSDQTMHRELQMFSRNCSDRCSHRMVFVHSYYSQEIPSSQLKIINRNSSCLCQSGPMGPQPSWI